MSTPVITNCLSLTCFRLNVFYQRKWSFVKRLSRDIVCLMNLVTVLRMNFDAETKVRNWAWSNNGTLPECPCTFSS